MSDLQRIGREIYNFGKLHEPDDRGAVRVVQTKSGEEVRWVLGNEGVL
jgi:hypothetical protein